MKPSVFVLRFYLVPSTAPRALPLFVPCARGVPPARRAILSGDCASLYHHNITKAIHVFRNTHTNSPVRPPGCMITHTTLIGPLSC